MWPFSSKKNYEASILSLQKEIKDARLTVVERRKSRRKFAVTRSVHMVLLWLTMSLCAWRRVVIDVDHPQMLIVGSFGSLVVVRKIILTWLDRRVTSQQQRIARLEKQREQLVKEYKKQTNFDKIQRVLEEASDKRATVDATKQTTKRDVRHGSILPHLPHKGQAGAQGPAANGRTQLAIMGPHESRNLQGAQATSANETQALVRPPTIAQPSPPSWLDRLAEAVLGVNEQSPANCFALICPRCYSHNGLAPYGEKASDVNYRCFACGLLNGPQASSEHSLAENQGPNAGPSGRTEPLSTPEKEPQPELEMSASEMEAELDSELKELVRAQQALPKLEQHAQDQNERESASEESEELIFSSDEEQDSGREPKPAPESKPEPEPESEPEQDPEPKATTTISKPSTASSSGRASAAAFKRKK